MNRIAFSAATLGNTVEVTKKMAGQNAYRNTNPSGQGCKSLEQAIPLRQWKWKLTKPYNGFTSYERIRGWQVTHWLIDVEELPNPKADNCACSICGKTKSVNYHNENYYEPWTAKLICQSCHYFVHTRFRIEHALPVLRKRGDEKESAEWVRALSTERINLAEQERQLHGDQVREFPVLIASYPSFPYAKLQQNFLSKINE